MLKWITLSVILCLVAPVCLGKSYDVIVVGGGTAGCVAAARISANPNMDVLLIAEGTDQSASPYSQIPLVNPIPGIASDFPYFVSPIFTQGNAFTNYRTNIELRPNIMDGGSGVNGGDFTFPPDQEWERLARLGITGWDKATMDNIRRSIETFRPESGPVPAGHGTSGPIETRAISPEVYLTAFMNQMMLATNTSFNPDTNLGNINGTGYVVRPLGGDNAAAAIGNFTRQGSCVKYLYPVMSRPNLRVIDRSVVVKVDKKGSCGSGTCVNRVNYIRDGEMYEAKVKRDGKIILSAGFYNSPKILMHSGIGNCSELEALEIDCIHDNSNVGKRVYNHLVFGQIYLAPMSPDWASHRGAIAATYYSANRSNDEINIETTYTSYPGTAYQVILVSNTLTLPYSSGDLKLKSKNWGDDVAVKFGQVDDPHDLAPLITALKNVRRAAAAMGLPEISPGPTTLPTGASDGQIAAWFKTVIKTIYHPTGSARMGLCDGNAVVDSSLRVCGVKNLMVADNSVWPESYYGHTTHTGALMIAEKAARMVLSQC